jgi:hypothetical protein
VSTLGLVEPAHKSVLGAGFLLSSLMLTHLNNGTPVVLSMLALRVVWSRLWYGQPRDHEQHNCRSSSYRKLASPQRSHPRPDRGEQL